MAGEKVRSVDSLGLCEHCHALLAMEDLDSDAIQVIPDCPHCRKIISGVSFGYEGNGQQVKTRWVGPAKQWVGARPAEDFNLGGWKVQTGQALLARVA